MKKANIVMPQVIQWEILKTILYQNVAYNCIKLNSFVPTVIGEWNTLPQEIRYIPSFKTFYLMLIK